MVAFFRLPVYIDVKKSTNELPSPACTAPYHYTTAFLCAIGGGIDASMHNQSKGDTFYDDDARFVNPHVTLSAWQICKQAYTHTH